MNSKFLKLCRRVAGLGARLPVPDALELFAAVLEFAEEAPEAAHIRHSAMLLQESRTQLEQFAKRRLVRLFVVANSKTR